MRIGVSSVEDVLALFGDDAIVHRHTDGKAFSISYDYRREGAYEPGRVGSTVRPSSLKIENNLVKTMHFGVYQRCLQTDRGLRTSSSLKEMEEMYGKSYVFTRGKPLDSYRYVALGLEVWGDPRSREVNSFFLFEPGKKEE